MNTQPTIKSMLETLIATPSISSVSPEFDHSNQALINVLANWLDELGFAVEILPLTGKPNKANLIATLGKGSGGLVLAGHTDTVPYDENRWSHNPFKLIESQNRYYGLGTSDMKSFFALAIEAARSFDVKQFKRPLILLATADEESSMDGAKDLVEQGKPKARYAIIGEPTGLKPVHLHKGIMMEAVHSYGRSGHSSDPSLGVNAIEGLQQALNLLSNWRHQLQNEHRDDRFKVAVPTLNLGLVGGGDNPNRICGHAHVHFDLRHLPGMNMEQLRLELDTRLANLSQSSPFHFQRQSLIEGTPALHTAEDSAIVIAAQHLTGHQSEAVAFCTEGPYLNQLGMETIILGPGDIAQAHQPDEYLELDRIQPTIHLLKKLISKFCITPEQ